MVYLMSSAKFVLSTQVRLKLTNKVLTTNLYNPSQFMQLNYDELLVLMG